MAPKDETKRDEAKADKGDDAAAPDDALKRDDGAPVEVTPTLLRSDSDIALADVPDNTPTPQAAPPKPGHESDEDDGDAPAGKAYVIHPKSGERCLVDEQSVPELLVDGYQRA